ncbi:MAG: response regulator transcription factor [Caldilineaceae bacterium]
MVTPETLTNREWEVLQLLAEGEKNKQIAKHLSITENTVEHHLKNIYAKLGVDNRVSASHWYWHCTQSYAA